MLESSEERNENNQNFRKHGKWGDAKQTEVI